MEEKSNSIQRVANKDIEIIEKIMYYNGKPFDGIVFILSESGKGNLHSEWQVQNGLRHGYYKHWVWGGILKLEETYANGIKHGIEKYFYPNGSIFSELNFKNGLKHGINKIYEQDGSIRKEEKFENNLLVEESEKKDKNQEISISNNLEFQNCISKYSLEDIKDFNLEIILKKGCGYEEIEFSGEHKGFKYTIKGGDSIKWFETENEYEDDIKTFIEDIEKIEIDNLDDELSFSYFQVDSFGFYGESIQWEEKTPKSIINEVEKEDSEYDNLISECVENNDYDNIETHLNDGGNIIYKLIISFNHKDINVKINWVNNKIK